MRVYLFGAFAILLVISLTCTILHASCPERPAESSALRYLGLVVSPISREQAIEYDLRSIDPGVEIVGVDYLSPAAQARLRNGDILLYADDKPVRSQKDLDAILLRLADPMRIRLAVLHEGERYEITLSVAPQPKGGLCFDVVPLCDRDSVRATLPDELAASDSLPVVSWVLSDAAVFNWAPPECGSVITGIGSSKVRMYGIVSVISPDQMKKVRSISDLSALSDSIHIGDVVLLQFYSRGKFRAARYMAQAPPKPWSGLRLEEMSPALIEAESLSVSGSEGAGLFVRKVEPGSPGERGGIKPRDLILGFNGGGIESVKQFEERYSTLLPDQYTRLSIRHADNEVDTLFLQRSAQLDYVHTLEPVPGMLRYERLGGTSYGYFSTVLPAFYWTKVTGPLPFGKIKAYFGSLSRHADADWIVGYGVDNERWQHRVNLSFQEAWIPTIRYTDGPMPFCREQLSSGVETWVFATFAGLDRLNYVWSTGWQFSWKLASPRLPAHAVFMNLDFARETAVPTVSQQSWISGRQEFSSNPVDDLEQGRFHRATLSYQYSNTRWRSWTRTLLDAEARIAGGALGGDYEYVRWELNGVRSQRIFRRIYLDSRLRAGLATGALPLQEEFYAGGPGTMPGFADREFSGNRTLLLNVSLSVVPFMAPEKSWQFRIFSGIDAGNAWRSDQYSDIPRLKSDFVTGIGLFWLGDGYLFPSGISVSWATPIDPQTGDWRTLVSFFGTFDRGGY